MALADRYEPLVGQALDDYIIEKVLGVGGQAVVFLAKNFTLQNVVALKVLGLIETADETVEAALGEARRQSQIDHPCVVKVFMPGVATLDFENRTRRVLYIPMQYARLGNCESEAPFCSGALTERDIDAMQGLLSGLQDVHQIGMVHNDVKPANVLRFDEPLFGETRTVLRLTDFGIATILSAIGQSGAPGFTLGYMAPERPDGRHSIRGDVYSMGATLFYMLTGRHPIHPTDKSIDPDSGPNASTRATTPGAIAAWQEAHRSQPRPNAMDFNPYCPPRLALLIMRMMSVEDRERPSLSECISVLKHIATSLRHAALGYPLPKELDNQLVRGSFPIRFVPEFSHIFKPDVHRVCGTSLSVLRIRMAHPVYQQYERLVQIICRRFSDSFSLYETYGTFDVHVLVWASEERLKGFKHDLDRDFPGSEVQLAPSVGVHHLHAQGDTLPDDANPVLALAVQDGLTLPLLDSASYLCDRFPTDCPAHSVRALTYVDAVDRPVNNFVRTAIVENVRKKLAALWRQHKVARTFKKLTLVELSPAFPHAVLLVNYVVSNYRDVHQVPTAIVELGENAVKTATFLETTRIVIQSDKILC